VDWFGDDSGMVSEAGSKKKGLTVYISQWDFGSRREDILLETHISRYLTPTNRQLWYGPWIG
jgi:hypothetical protein